MTRKTDYATIKAASAWTRTTRAPRLDKLADFIRENMPQYTVTLEESWTNTDTQIGRLRVAGKGRSGKELIVRDQGKVIFRHDSSETYRTNDEVCRWIVQQLEAESA